MRYELRLWNDSEHTDYTVRASSNNIDMLKHLYLKPSTPNDEFYRSFIYDTVDKKTV